MQILSRTCLVQCRRDKHGETTPTGTEVNVMQIGIPQITQEKLCQYQTDGPVLGAVLQHMRAGRKPEGNSLCVNSPLVQQLLNSGGRRGILCRPGWFPSIAADFLHDYIEKYSRSYMLGFLVATWVKNKHSNGSWNGSTGLFNGRIHRIGAKCAIHVLVGNPQHLTERLLRLHNFWMHQCRLLDLKGGKCGKCVSVGPNGSLLGSLLKVGSGLHVCHSKPGGHYCCTEVNR